MNVSHRLSRTIALSLGMLFLCSSTIGCPSALAATTPDTLGTLESRLFEHDYPQDTQKQRLERLEKMIFGQTRSGTDEKRLSALVAAMPSQNKVGGRGATPVKNDYPLQPFTADNHPAQTQAPVAEEETPSYAPPAVPQPTASAPSMNGIEPLVSALEMHVHGNTNKSRPLGERITTLENSVAGSANADHSGSLTQRLTRLQGAVGYSAEETGPPVDYKKAYTSQEAVGEQAKTPKPNNGHPLLRKAAEAAVVAGAVAGVAALTIMATKGMGGGGSLGMARRLIPHRDLF